jgi:cellulose synthase/poly-beta-1,6-N-acetylglucosamine synthase-like glycosyltransferase
MSSAPWQWLNRHAGWLFLAGLAAVAFWNGRKWRQDRALALRLREQKPGPVQLQATPPVSVLVAAWNEAGFVEAHIESFLKLRYPHKELVLCAGGSDGTYALARQYAGESVRILQQQPGEGKQRALRRCLAEARGEIIFLTDADCLLDDGSFQATLRPIVCEGEDAATGTYRPLPGQERHPFVGYQWALQASAQARAGDYSPGLSGANCALRRSALVRTGGFDREARTGTDYSLAGQLIAAGYRIRHVPGSAVATEYPTSVGRHVRQHSRWLSNLFLHGLTTGDRFHLRHALVTGSIGIVGLALPFLAGLVGPWVLVLWLWLVAHSLLARLRYLALAFRSGVPVRLAVVLRLPLFLAADWLAWAYGLVRVFSPAVRWRW